MSEAPAAIAHVMAVVVHYAGLEDTRACLASLEPALDPGSIVLVDNSEDGEGLALARRELPGVVALGDHSNLGFAAGSNLGIRHALEMGATHVLLLNPDALLERGALEPLLESARDPLVGIVGGKVLLLPKEAGERRIASAGCGHDFLWLTHSRGEGALDGPPWDTACDVDFVSGCFALVRRDVLEKVGLLDERFFLYYEDADLCERARRAGFRVRYEPGAVAWHRVHGALLAAPRDVGPMVSYYSTRNQILYAQRRLGRGLALGAFLVLLLLRRTVRAAIELAHGHPDRAMAHGCGFRDGLLARTGKAPRGAWPGIRVRRPG